MAKGVVRRTPRGTAWITQIFDKAILKDPHGVVFRKVTSVERHTSESLLLSIARSRRFSVSRIGSHYAIHRPTITLRNLI